MNKLIDPELESLSNYHLEYDDSHNRWHYDPEYGLMRFWDAPEEPEPYWEPDQLLMTDGEVRIVALWIKSEKLVDNEIPDWDLVSLEIDIRAGELELTRLSAWNDIRDLALELYEYGLERQDKHLPYI